MIAGLAADLRETIMADFDHVARGFGDLPASSAASAATSSPNNSSAGTAVVKVTSGGELVLFG